MIKHTNTNRNLNRKHNRNTKFHKTHKSIPHQFKINIKQTSNNETQTTEQPPNQAKQSVITSKNNQPPRKLIKHNHQSISNQIISTKPTPNIIPIHNAKQKSKLQTNKHKQSIQPNKHKQSTIHAQLIIKSKKK